MKKSPVPALPLKTNSLLRRMWEAESYSLVLALIIVSTLFEVIVPTEVVTVLVTVVFEGAWLLLALRATGVRGQVLLAALVLMLLVVEAILGQLYLVTIVALLVSTYNRKQQPE